MTPEAHLLVEVRDGIALLTMNRPVRLNALSPAMIDRAIDTLERVAGDPAVGCSEGFTQRRAADHREGVTAFAEKRAPRFTGR